MSYSIQLPVCQPEQQAKVALLVSFLSWQEAHATTTWYAPVSVEALDVDAVTESDALVSNISPNTRTSVGIKGAGTSLKGCLSSP